MLLHCDHCIWFSSILRRCAFLSCFTSLIKKCQLIAITGALKLFKKTLNELKRLNKATRALANPTPSYTKFMKSLSRFWRNGCKIMPTVSTKDTKSMRLTLQDHELSFAQGVLPRMSNSLGQVSVHFPTGEIFHWLEMHSEYFVTG